MMTWIILILIIAVIALNAFLSIKLYNNTKHRTLEDAPSYEEDLENSQNYPIYRLNVSSERVCIDKQFDYDYVPSMGDALLDCFSFGNHKPYWKYTYKTEPVFDIMVKNTRHDNWHSVYRFNDMEDAKNVLNNLEKLRN